MKSRIVKIVLGGLGICAIGVALLWVISKTGFGLPCILHSITGFLCPSCGTQRMLVALLKLDFGAAYYYNAALLIVLPMIIVLIVWQAVYYIRYGKINNGKMINIIYILLAVYFILFGIIRNF